MLKAMSEYAVAISNLNDFIFCPVSIYYHMLDEDNDNMTYQSPDQLNGSAAHKAVDAASYSSSANILQGISVYSEKYDLFGKIDTFDMGTGVLRERKKRIKVIYEGYIFQLYAQYYCLCEMGYKVNKLVLYSMDDNKSYQIPFPDQDIEMKKKFQQILLDIKSFRFDSFTQTNAGKCLRCIYEPLCSFSKNKEK